MTTLINGKEYLDGTIFQVALQPEFKMLAGIQDNVKNIEIINLNATNLQHGMTIIDCDKEIIVDSILIEPKDKRTTFYQMHIYKTAGLSLKEEIIDYFNGTQTYCNFIGLIDDYQMLSSNFISGHFASYPLNLFESNEKKIKSFTLVRDPIERTISHYLYEFKINSPYETPNIKDLEFFVEKNKNIIKDFQTKNLTSTMNKNLAERNASLTIKKQISLSNSFRDLGSTSRFLENKTEELFWQKHLEKISLIGTIENKDIFMEKLNTLLNSEGYKSNNITKKYINKNYFGTEDFLKQIPMSIINKIKELNQNDIAMYEFVKGKGL